MPHYNASSQFEPNGSLTTSADAASPLQLQGGMGGENQLLSLLGGGMSFQQKLARERLKMMQDQARMAQMEAKLRMAQQQQGLQSQRNAEMGVSRGVEGPAYAQPINNRTPFLFGGPGSETGPLFSTRGEISPYMREVMKQGTMADHPQGQSAARLASAAPFAKGVRGI